MKFYLGQIVAVIYEHGLCGENPTTDNVFGTIVKIQNCRVTGKPTYEVKLRDGSTFSGSDCIVALP